MTTTTPRPGRRQAEILRALDRHNGTWFYGCGWVFDAPAATDRTMASMVKHGWVTHTIVTGDLPTHRTGRPYSYNRYDLTDTGRAAHQTASR